MGITCNVFYDERERKIVAELPITLQTSLVRVKDVDGNPVGSVRLQNLKENWYIEWQISYFDENRRLVELGEMFRLLVTKWKVIDEAEIKELYSYLKNRDAFFEETFFVHTEKDEEKDEKAEKFEGFTLLYKKAPILRKQLSDGSFIHIELRHKQRAVGYQAMLYIFIPMGGVMSRLDGSPVVGRPARQNEIVLWFPTKENIIELMKGFSVMSKKHLKDIISIVEKFL